jgi:hypothetical protein
MAPGLAFGSAQVLWLGIGVWAIVVRVSGGLRARAELRSGLGAAVELVLGAVGVNVGVSVKGRLGHE